MRSTLTARRIAGVVCTIALLAGVAGVVAPAAPMSRSGRKSVPTKRFLDGQSMEFVVAQSREIYRGVDIQMGW